MYPPKSFPFELTVELTSHIHGPLVTCSRHIVLCDGNPLQPGVTPPITKCCPTWSGKSNATNAACVERNQKKACADEYYCANPNPATVREKKSTFSAHYLIPFQI